mgnify:CR=1 FL=1
MVLFGGVSALDIGVGIHGMAGLFLRNVFGRYALIELHRMISCSVMLQVLCMRRLWPGLLGWLV